MSTSLSIVPAVAATLAAEEGQWFKTHVYIANVIIVSIEIELIERVKMLNIHH